MPLRQTELERYFYYVWSVSMNKKETVGLYLFILTSSGQLTYSSRILSYCNRQFVF